jgi:hypothetical protein
MSARLLSFLDSYASLLVLLLANFFLLELLSSSRSAILTQVTGFSGATGS